MLLPTNSSRDDGALAASMAWSDRSVMAKDDGSKMQETQVNVIDVQMNIPEHTDESVQHTHTETGNTGTRWSVQMT